MISSRRGEPGEELRAMLDMAKELSFELSEEEEAATLPLGEAAKKSDDQNKAKYVLVHMATNRGFDITKPRFLIGSSPDCDLVIEGSGRGISRNHCYITIKGDRLYLTDNSKNGSFLGEPGSEDPDFSRLPKDLEVEVRPWQVIRLAAERFLLVKRGERS